VSDLVRRTPRWVWHALVVEVAMYRNLLRGVLRRRAVPDGAEPVGYAQAVTPVMWLWIFADRGGRALGSGRGRAKGRPGPAQQRVDPAAGGDLRRHAPARGVSGRANVTVELREPLLVRPTRSRELAVVRVSFWVDEPREVVRGPWRRGRPTDGSNDPDRVAPTAAPWRWSRAAEPDPQEVAMTTRVAPSVAHDRRAEPLAAALEQQGLLDPLRHAEALAVLDEALTRTGGRSAQPAEPGMQAERPSRAVRSNLQHARCRHRKRRPARVILRVLIGNQRAERVVAAAEVQDDEIAPGLALGDGQVRQERRRRKGKREGGDAAFHEFASGH